MGWREESSALQKEEEKEIELSDVRKGLRCTAHMEQTAPFALTSCVQVSDSTHMHVVKCDMQVCARACEDKA